MFDSDSLLACVRAELQPGAALILAAPGGREAIQDGLEATGWQVRLVPVYRRELLTPDPALIDPARRGRGNHQYLDQRYGHGARDGCAE